MVRIVLVMHAPLGQAFAACAAHILGYKPLLTVFDIAPDDPIELRVEQLFTLLTEPYGKPNGEPNSRRSAEDGILILCDIFGATPFNIANRALKKALEGGMVGHLITGTNLCMVLKAVTEQQEAPDELSEKVRLGALKGIVNADCRQLS